MKTKNDTWGWITERAAVALLAVAVILLMLALFSCSGVPMPRHDEMVGRASVGTGMAHVKGEMDNLTTGETERESGSGGMTGVRLELAKHPDYMTNTAVGLRFQGTFRDVVEDGLGAGGTGRMDLETKGLELHGVIRRYFPVTRTVRPYAELFGGVSYNAGDLALTGGTLSSPVSGSDYDWSGVGGTGLGVEFDLSDKASIFFQGDYSIRMGEADPLSLQLQDITLWVGGEVRF